MSQPGPEARISNLEKQTISLGARIEELAADTAEGLRDIKQDIKQLNDGMMASFKQIGDTFMAFGDTMATKEDLATLEGRIKDDIANIEAIMATKDDIANIEAIMATKDDIASIKATQELILQLLSTKAQ